MVQLWNYTIFSGQILINLLPNKALTEFHKNRLRIDGLISEKLTFILDNPQSSSAGHNIRLAYIWGDVSVSKNRTL